jgi:tetratricopeptide (TPR) repeat protein
MSGAETELTKLDDPAIQAAIRTALASVQASASFSGSRQLSLFLGYVVAKTLSGEGDRIKAYSIATEALNRPESFDPASDPIVRVEAGRLRRALGAYYKAEGASDPIRITIPRGTYVPRFERAEATTADMAVELSLPGGGEAGEPAPSRAGGLPGRPNGKGWIAGVLALLALVAALGLVAIWLLQGTAPGPTVGSAPSTAPSVTALPASANPMAPRIFVQPFALSRDASIGVTCSQFAAQMSTALARFDEISVVTRTDGDADYVMSGTLSDGPAGVSAAALLSDRASGRVIWSQKLTVPRNPIQPSFAIGELIASLAVAVAQPYGVVMSDRLARADASDDGYACLIRAFEYWRDFTMSGHAEIRACLEDLIRRYPTFGLAYAMLAFTHLDGDGLAFAVNSDSPALDKAVKAASTAVQLAPNSARAKQALQLAYLATGQTARAIETGERAMALNPLDTDVRAGHGLVLIVTGQHQHGARLIEQSEAQNAAYPPWYDLYLGLAAFQAGNEEAMRSLINRAGLSNHPLAVLLGLIAGGRDGSAEAKVEVLADIRARFPELVRDPGSVLRRSLPNEALVTQLEQAARAAGL